MFLKMQGEHKYLYALITDGAANFDEAHLHEFHTMKRETDTEHIRHIRLAGDRNNNCVERFNGEVRQREKVMRTLKRLDTPILSGYRIYHNYMRPHEALEGRTPSEVAGIEIAGNDKWMTHTERGQKECEVLRTNCSQSSHRSALRRDKVARNLVAVLLFCSILTIIPSANSQHSHNSSNAKYSTTYSPSPVSTTITGTSVTSSVFTIAAASNHVCDTEEIPFYAAQGDIVSGTVSTGDYVITYAIMTPNQRNTFFHETFTTNGNCANLQLAKTELYGQSYENGPVHFHWEAPASGVYYLEFQSVTGYATVTFSASDVNMATTWQIMYSPETITISVQQLTSAQTTETSQTTTLPQKMPTSAYSSWIIAAVMAAIIFAILWVAVGRKVKSKD